MAGRRRKRSGLEQLRRAMYFGQRGIGDYEAAERGRLGRRLVRRAATRTLFRMFRG
jgi:hypothetical protein